MTKAEEYERMLVRTRSVADCERVLQILSADPDVFHEDVLSIKQRIEQYAKHRRRNEKAIEIEYKVLEQTREKMADIKK